MLSEAESLVSKAIDADQSHPAFYTLKGFIMLKRKDYLGAAKYFDTAIKLEKDDLCRNRVSGVYPAPHTTCYYSRRICEKNEVTNSKR